MRRIRNTYWHSNTDWFIFNQKMNYVMKDDAPEEAKESFRLYKKEMRQYERTLFWRNIRYTLCFWERWL